MRLMVVRVVAVLFMLGSAGLYALLARVDTVSCDRGAGACLVTHGAVFGGSTETFAVADLTGAELDTSNAGRGGWATRSSRVMFLTKKGPVPFVLWFTNVAPRKMNEQVAAVNRYVATPSMTRLDLRFAERVTALFGAGILLFGGLGLLVSSVFLKPILLRPR